MSIVAVEFPSARFHQKPTSHPNDEIIVCREGSGFLVIDGKEYQINKGDILVVPAGFVHEDIAPLMRKQCIVFLTDEHAGFMKNPKIVHDDGQALSKLAMLLSNVTLDDAPNMRPFHEALGDAFMTKLRQEVEETTNHVSRRSLRAIHQLNEQIQQNFTNFEFDITAAEEASGLSPRYLQRMFREEYGRSPRQQLMHFRLQHAKNQMDLFGDTFSIKVYAHESGFMDPYYFSRLFRQTMGCSPKAYLSKVKAAN